MNPRELKAARALLILLHEQADRTPKLRPRLAAFRTALACIEAVQAATEPAQPLRVTRSLRAPELAPTVVGDYSPTLYTPAYARTELATLMEPRP